MPTHELKDLGFVFPVTSEDIAKGSKTFLLPRHPAVFAMHTKQTEPGSWADEKFPLKKDIHRGIGVGQGFIDFIILFLQKHTSCLRGKNRKPCRRQLQNNLLTGKNSY